jgi:hypothetical protein
VQQVRSDVHTVWPAEPAVAASIEKAPEFAQSSSAANAPPRPTIRTQPDAARTKQAISGQVPAISRISGFLIAGG